MTISTKAAARKAAELAQENFSFAPKVPSKRRQKSCQCSGATVREEKSAGGTLLATVCASCTLPVRLACPACARDCVDLQSHLRLSTECFRKADPWGYRQAMDKESRR